MSIPCYYALEWKDSVNIFPHRAAQLGFGFREDGSARMPERQIADAPILIDDSVLPNRLPTEQALHRMAVAAQHGCFFDFERPVNRVATAIMLSLFQLLPQTPTVVPEEYHIVCPEAFVSVQAPFCNNWRAFTQEAGKRYGQRWILEEMPWDLRFFLHCGQKRSGLLKAALLRYESGEGLIRYYDTEETIQEKREIAATQGCRAAICLYQDIKQLHQQKAFDK